MDRKAQKSVLASSGVKYWVAAVNNDRASVIESLLREILPKLHQIAIRQLRKERYVTPLSATELIHEVWIQKFQKAGFKLRDREHFYGIAAQAMGQVLVDLARRRLALCRGSGETHHSIDAVAENDLPAADYLASIVEVGQLIDRLEVKNPVAVRIAEFHYYAGFAFEEIAAITRTCH